MKLKFVMFFSVMLLFGLLFLRFINNPTKVNSNTDLEVRDVLFYDERNFIEGVNRAEENFKNPGYKIFGAVVNHHTLASFMIADVFKKIAVQPPKTIILVGPNHYEKGSFNVLTSNSAWRTNYGTITSDETVITELLSKNLAKIDEETLQNDHATTVLLPFIKFYMPQVKVVQLLISKKLTLSDAQKLSEELSMIVPGDVVIVASTDFSHYLTAGQANIKDGETIKTINSFDYGTLFSYNSDHLDSPGSIAVLLMTMQKISKTHQEILYHENSATVRPDLDSFTTSYYSILYH